MLDRQFSNLENAIRMLEEKQRGEGRPCEIWQCNLPAAVEVPHKTWNNSTRELRLCVKHYNQYHEGRIDFA